MNIAENQMKMYFGILLILALNGFNEVQADDVEKFQATTFKPYEESFKTNVSERNSRIHLKNFQEETYGDLSSCKICGLSNEFDHAPMIVNGTRVVPPYKYPWMVAITVKKSEMEGKCGGVLLNEYFILSAAHCFKKNSPNQIAVEFVTKTNDVEPGPPVEAIIPHPRYTSSGFRYDIALLKLSLKLTFSQFRSPICLPSANFRPRIGATFTTTGWGTEGGGKEELTDDLREAKIKLVNFNVCKRIFQYPRYFKRYMYCLVGVQHQGPCEGDSGGPMFSKYRGKYRVLGITSHGSDEECDPEKPFVYTAVPNHIPWIKEEMRSSFLRVPRPLGEK